jgi:hypothetical protein
MTFDVIGECVGANGKDAIVTVEECNDLFAGGGQESRKQRMIFRKPATSAHGRCPNPGVMLLGQANDIVESIVAIDRGARNKDGTFAYIKCVADSFNHPRIWPNLAAHHAFGD